MHRFLMSTLVPLIAGEPDFLAVNHKVFGAIRKIQEAQSHSRRGLDNDSVVEDAIENINKAGVLRRSEPLASVGAEVFLRYQFRLGAI